MSTSQEMPQMTLEQFELESTSLVIQFLAVLTGRTLPTGVVMQAAMNLHRCVACQLSVEAQGQLSMAMAAYAGELMQGLPPAPVPSPTQSTNLH